MIGASAERVRNESIVSSGEVGVEVWIYLIVRSGEVGRIVGIIPDVGVVTPPVPFRHRWVNLRFE